ncbi:unnamed protein product [Peronospora effusa]|nr:unnamed protein product [Peronospora effusa]
MLFSVPEVAMQRNSVRSWTKPTATSGCPQVKHGCHQTVCKECSEKHQIFRLNKSGRAQKRLFCAVCVKNVTGKTHLGPRSSPIESGYDTSECSVIGTHSMRSSSRRSICSRCFSRTVNFKHPPDVFRPCVLPSDDEAPIELNLDW